MIKLIEFKESLKNFINAHTMYGEVFLKKFDYLLEDMAKENNEPIQNADFTIIKNVTVHYDRSNLEALQATGRTLNSRLNSSIISRMPRSESSEIEVIFFKLKNDFKRSEPTTASIKKEYELRGLNPVDPFSLAAINEQDPTFADKYPNYTFWYIENTSRPQCIAFGLDSTNNTRYVDLLDFMAHSWDTWYAGVKKK